MTAVVQAMCPGCRNVLRIPAEWVHQPIKCKHCGTVLQVRGPAVPAPAPVPVPVPVPPPARTPPPQRRPAAPPAIMAPPAAIPVATPGHVRPPQPVTPTARNEAARKAWSDFDTREFGPRRRRSSGWMIGPAILLGVLAIVGAAAVVAYPFYHGLSEKDGDGERTASRDKGKTDKTDLSGGGTTDTATGHDKNDKDGPRPKGDTAGKKDDTKGPDDMRDPERAAREAEAKRKAELVGKHLADAQKAVEAQQFDAAFQSLNEAARLAPDSPEVRTARARAETARADYLQKQGQANMDEERRLAQARGLVADARKAIAAKQFDQADRLLAEARKLSPGDADVRKAGEELAKARNPEPPLNAVWPRRVLMVSVHNYFYANPISAGSFYGSGLARNLPRFLADRTVAIAEKRVAPLETLHVDGTQVQHLSDAAGKDKTGKDASRPPHKAVIEAAFKNFLDSSRAQDHIMVFFVCHSVEIEGEVYLVPLEGDMESADTLIPVKWLLAEMGKCKAAQKILVLDVNRFNPTAGQERPGSGPMSEKLDALLKTPPPGVDVWVACSVGEQSYETEDSEIGAFLDDIWSVLAPPEKDPKNPNRYLDSPLTREKIQRPGDPIPIEKLVELVNERMQKELKPQKLKQTSKLYRGPAMESVAKYDPSEPMNPLPPLPVPATADNLKIAQGVLDEIGLPPVKAGSAGAGIRFDMLPPFPAGQLADYQAAAEDNALRQAVREARATLWAIMLPNANEPKDLAADIKRIRADLGNNVNLGILKDGFRYPANENALKGQIEANERQVAKIMSALDDVLTRLQDKDVKELRDKEGKRWQANYDFTVARVEAEIAYLYEYQTALGQMRKELPPLDRAVYGGWKLASKAELQGDAQGKKLYKNAAKIYDGLLKEHKGTPWEVLARREKMTAVGLEWAPAK